MFTTIHRAAFAALACICMLAGCDDAPQEGQQQATPAARKTPTTETATLPNDMVAAVSAGKAANAISVHFALRASPTVNQPLPVDIAILPHGKFALVGAHFESHDGLVMTSGGVFGPKTAIASEKPLAHQLVLLPVKEGMFVVSVSVETESEEGNVSRIFSIPVIVSAATPAPGSAPGSATPAPGTADTPPGD